MNPDDRTMELSTNRLVIEGCPDGKSFFDHHYKLNLFIVEGIRYQTFHIHTITKLTCIHITEEKISHWGKALVSTGHEASSHISANTPAKVFPLLVGWHNVLILHVLLLWLL
mgnify:CR=1 FL=1